MPVSPDCKSGSHRACHGDAWDSVMDSPAECSCECHRIKPGNQRGAKADLVIIDGPRTHEDAFGITHGITTEQAVGFAIAQLGTLGEAVPTIRRLRGVIEQKQIEGN